MVTRVSHAATTGNRSQKGDILASDMDLVGRSAFVIGYFLLFIGHPRNRNRHEQAETEVEATVCMKCVQEQS